MVTGKAFSVLVLCLLSATGNSFSLRTARQLNVVSFDQSIRQSASSTNLFSSNPRNENESTIDRAPSLESKQAEPKGTTYPVDVPSPILLASSMFLAIVGTGSVFDLGGGAPKYGFGPTAAIVAVAIPSCLFLFYASILKATAETEADDKEYMKGKY